MDKLFSELFEKSRFVGRSPDEMRTFEEEAIEAFVKRRCIFCDEPNIAVKVKGISVGKKISASCPSCGGNWYFNKNYKHLFGDRAKSVRIVQPL